MPGAEFKSWRDVTRAFIDEEFIFTRGLPPDSNVVTPIAPLSEDPGPDLLGDLETVQARLPDWPPGRVSDPVQRVRNLLLVAAVPDVLQMQIESYLPLVVFAEIQRTVPEADLIKVLAWIGLRPEEGSDTAVTELGTLGLPAGAPGNQEVRYRANIYAVKLLGAILGKRPFRP